MVKLSDNEEEFVHDVYDVLLTPGEIEYVEKFHQTTWITNDGQVIPIVELQDRHLRNIIFYLNKRFGQLQERDAKLEIPLYETSCSVIMGNTPLDRWPIYADLCKEADRRNLKWVPESNS